MLDAGKLQRLYAKVCAKFKKAFARKKPIQWEGENLLELIYKHQVEGIAMILQKLDERDAWLYHTLTSIDSRAQVTELIDKVHYLEALCERAFELKIKEKQLDGSNAQAKTPPPS